MSDASELFKEELRDKIVNAAVDYRFWFTYFLNSVEQNKASSDSETKLKWQRDMDESERYIKDTRKKLFDLTEKYNAEVSAQALREKESEGG